MKSKQADTQLRFDNGEVISNSLYEFKAEFGKDVGKIFTCPYCGYQDSINNWLIYRGKSLSKKMVACGACKLEMRRTTLQNTETPEWWGKWLYYTRQYDNFRKPRINYDKIKTKLRELHWSYRFWTAYYDAKRADGWTPEQDKKEESVEQQYASYQQHYPKGWSSDHKGEKD